MTTLGACQSSQRQRREDRYWAFAMQNADGLEGEVVGGRRGVQTCQSGLVT